VIAVAEDKRTKIGSTGPQLSHGGTPAPAAGTPAPIEPGASVPSNHATSYLPPTVDPLIGVTLVGRYLIQKKLGEGGMGAVYLATHNLLDKQVALKILHTEFSRKPDLVERFMQEAKSASRIRHENVIDISDFGTTPEGLVFFAMELLKGHDLHEEVARARLAGELLPWVRSKKIFLQICSALVAAHSHGIIHRDLKPENVYLIDFLGEPDFVKLLDFGIAKLTEVDEGGRKLTKTGMLFGTPEYMSPEQARGENVDHRVDVYAMGCILFQLVTGKVPFEADNFMGVLSMHLTEPPPSIPVDVFDRIGAPRELAAVIDRALLKDRNQRHSSILELANAVRQVSGDPLSSGLTAHAMPAQSPRVAAPASTTTSRQRTQWTGNVQVPTDEDGPGKGKSKIPLIIGGVLLAAAAAAAAMFAVNGRSGTGDTAGSAGSGEGTGSAGSGTVLAGGGSQVPPPITPDAGVAAPPPIENLPPLPSTVKVKLSSKPKGAAVTELSADGKPKRLYPQKTPLNMIVPGSRERQSFSIHLSGYGDTIVDLIPDRDLEYTVTLEKGESSTPKRQTIPAGPVTTPAAGSAAKPPDAGSAAKPPDVVKPPEACPDPPCEVLKPFNAGSGG
jgi:serine/threonine protein kinase